MLFCQVSNIPIFISKPRHHALSHVNFTVKAKQLHCTFMMNWSKHQTEIIEPQLPKYSVIREFCIYKIVQQCNTQHLYLLVRGSLEAIWGRNWSSLYHDMSPTKNILMTISLPPAILNSQRNFTFLIMTWGICISLRSGGTVLNHLFRRNWMSGKRFLV
jgi:hypothetical protein